jgi:hypothetical protein
LGEHGFFLAEAHLSERVEMTLSQRLKPDYFWAAADGTTEVVP